MEQLNRLMDTIGYQFHNEQLLRQALRHPSLGPVNNQRLEFLGDAVLQLLISHRIYTRHPELHEGALTRLRQRLVCEQALADIARRIGLGEYMTMDHGSDISGVRGQSGSLSDAMEAVLAAVYLDGGFERARDVVNRLWPDQASLAEDAKSRLQEVIQSKGGQAPTYQLMREEGPDHARVFTVRVNLDGGRFAEAQGQSKKKAEQAAAERMLASLEGYSGQ